MHPKYRHCWEKGLALAAALMAEVSTFPHEIFRYIDEIDYIILSGCKVS